MKLLIGFFAICSIASGSTPIPGSWERGIIDHLLPRGPLPIEEERVILVMEDLSLGSLNQLDVEFVRSRIPVSAETLKHARFGLPYVRTYAIERLGQTHYPGLLNWFNRFTKEALRQQEVMDFWPAIQVAKCQAEYDLLLERERRAYLEAHFDDRSDSDSSAAVHSWAVDTACNAGLESLIGSVHEALMARNPQAGESRTEFCEDRIRAVNRLGNRRDSLLFLLGEYSSSSPKLVRWAVDQLQEYRDPAVQRLLDTFIRSVQELPGNSDIKARYLYIVQGLDGKPILNQ